MTKIEKEAKLYESVSTKKLKRVIMGYKFLSFANSKTFNFITTLIFMLIPYFLFCEITMVTFCLIILFHYFIFMEYMYEYKGNKFVNDDDKYEIDQVLKILERNLKARKNPST